jgi:putative membrane protein
MQEIDFEINRDAVEQYFRTIQSLALLTLIFFFGIGLILALIHYFSFGHWLCPRLANALRYRIEGSVLRVDSGVMFLSRKSRPLERITDVALVQGPLLRHFGIWAMQIQTAGSALCEAVLCGVRNPEEVRELILSQRQRIYGEKAGDA